MGADLIQNQAGIKLSRQRTNTYGRGDARAAKIGSVDVVDLTVRRLGVLSYLV